MKAETGIAAAAIIGVLIFLTTRKTPAPTPAPNQKKKLPPRPKKTRAQEESDAKEEAAQRLAPPVLGPRPVVPFEFIRDDSNVLAARREYEGYLDGSLPLEVYPYVWFFREDQVILKVGPGKWVEVDEHPITLFSLLGIDSPSWLTIAMFGTGVALAAGPEVLAFYGIESGMEALAAARLAHKAAQVILAARESTGAGVAELAVQLYSLPGAGPTFGDVLQDQLRQAGMRVVVKGAAKAALDE